MTTEREIDFVAQHIYGMRRTADMSPPWASLLDETRQAYRREAATVLDGSHPLVDPDRPVETITLPEEDCVLVAEENITQEEYDELYSVFS